MNNIHIEQITPELTWRLRRDELYPNEMVHQMEMEEDSHGMHFGAFRDNQLVAVVSLFRQGQDFQFRKFAVRADMQGQKIGEALLTYVTDYARAEGGTRIWCNARDTAFGFYRKYGFTATGNIFIRKGINYQIMEKKL
ncbi:GNAT family N-acetyltransferase [Mucilaginibacter sp. RS28]|uniref:GNAT family N-acetyltransferase n=1 Tax=Mucilaginibacter straminoryzae TaxID=2932774 RepID=A0A9X2BBE9_9SPHI|nr:GNAT family N-acetyltransferase [Mucilaginibacter straminoryzae]MCJ8211710.1 GNAT family N-acetyltransferase [Mucilaginibacter straminoryzae]